MMPNWITLGGCQNARDLGGLRTEDGGVTRSGVLLRSGDPDELTGEDIEALVNRHGLSMVVDLRAEFERSEASALEASGVKVRWCGLHDDKGVRESVASLPASLTSEEADDLLVPRYLATAERFQAHAAELLAEFTAGSGAVLVHCAAGKDRTGVVVSLLLLAAGVRKDDVVADYAATDLCAAGLLSRAQRNLGLLEHWDSIDQVPLALVRTRAATIERFITELEASHGSVGDWWHRSGAEADHLAAWRGRLVQVER